MLQKIIWLLLVSVIYFGQNCYGSNDSSKEVTGAFGYEILQYQMDCLKDSQNKILDELASVTDISKIVLERQNTLMEQLILTIANSTVQNRIEHELTKQTIDKQNVLMEQILDINYAMNNDKHPYDVCKSAKFSGLFKIPSDYCPNPVTVFCEMDTFGGEWIVTQQRLDGSVNFTRNWQEYREGFGIVGKLTEFWLGLEHIHQITNSGHYRLVIELKDGNGKYGFARYSEFKIAGEKEKYRLVQLGEHSGTINDALSYHYDGKFSTSDQDNDDSSAYCAQNYHSGGGWWYKDCSYSALNGAYLKNQQGYGIYWSKFSSEATFSRMMIRRN